MKKAIILIFGVTILQLNFACKSQYSVTELNNNFTSEQIADLKKITTFFKNQMCLNMDSDFKTCYERIPHEYLEATGNGFWTNIDFEEQKELYKQISRSTFDKIWWFCKSIEYKTGKEKKSLCANAIGEYNNYLFDLGKHNPKIKEYAHWINASGDFNPLQMLYSKVSKNKKYFDLNDPNVQLILAIHYLSLNDQAKRNEKWSTE
ncbi:hypothetical protein [Aequorivita marina]|uniref:hypothetical protein n=1 Tax=Aequorivita marina TaxID=3073654 RepID=UPI0028756A73|nr:hypothetical protein [Aequorivita sp. S2608]MDS1298701.1 hypothetical protein [Aequorivita sp. S2608]